VTCEVSRAAIYCNCVRNSIVSMSSPIDLLHAFEQKNFGKFQESLEVFLASPNGFDEITNGRTIFETILSTPKSADYIKLCLKNDADFYMVSEYNADDFTLFVYQIIFYTIATFSSSSAIPSLEKQQWAISNTLRDGVGKSGKLNGS
jgi:hypothetical protein